MQFFVICGFKVLVLSSEAGNEKKIHAQLEASSASSHWYFFFIMFFKQHNYKDITKQHNWC